MGTVCIQNDRLLDEAPTEALSWYPDQYRKWAKEFAKSQYGDDFYFDGDPAEEFVEWKRRVRRRIEDRMRKDADALLACAMSIHVDIS